MNIDLTYHIPIMANEVVNSIITNPKGIYVDGTFGGGGHAVSILKRLSPSAKCIGIDQDPTAIKHGEQFIEIFKNLILVHNNFHNIKTILNQLNINKINGCLLDLGVSSHQIDTPSRGFSYNNDAFLDMRMNTSSGITASEYLNSVNAKTFEHILYNYADEKWAKRIANELVKFRTHKKITTTFDLVKIVDNAIPLQVRFQTKGHSAKKTFQAVRIAINNEIEPLENALKDIVDSLDSGGRLCVITFHSIEDRIVKTCFNQLEKPCTCPPKLPICICGKKSLGVHITKKPILPTSREIEENIRSHSAKLRIFEKK